MSLLLQYCNATAIVLQCSKPKLLHAMQGGLVPLQHCSKGRRSSAPTLISRFSLSLYPVEYIASGFSAASRRLVINGNHCGNVVCNVVADKQLQRHIGFGYLRVVPA